MIKLLLVEDNLAILALLQQTFADSSEYEVSTAVNGSEALTLLHAQTFDVMVLDWMLPNLSGLELCRRIKSDDTIAQPQVIMLSAKGEEEDRVLGLDAGADDYVVKPFLARELQSRVKAAARRVQRDKHKVLAFGELQIDLHAHSVSMANQQLNIAPTELKLLMFFAQNVNRALSRQQILDGVWGATVYVDDRTVDVHIGRLRKALQVASSHEWVQTVRSVGYRFEPPA